MDQNSDTKWTKWIYSNFKYHNLNGKEVLIIYRHRYDKKYRKLIQAKIISGKGKGIKIKSSCHKNDVFN